MVNTPWSSLYVTRLSTGLIIDGGLPPSVAGFVNRPSLIASSTNFGFKRVELLIGRPATPSVEVICNEETSSVTYSSLNKHLKETGATPMDSSISVTGSSIVQSASTGDGRTELYSFKKLK